MSSINDNEYNALIDALKNITDVVSVLTSKINLQEEEIIKLKKNNVSIEENIINLKNKIQTIHINSSKLQITDLNTDEEQNLTKHSEEIPKINNNQYIEETNIESDYDNLLTEPTTIRETEIEKLKKYKAIQIVDKLIQKKKELTTQNKDEKNDKDKKVDKDDKDDKDDIKQSIVAKRKNKIMRRF